jgi:hypothetical protein
MDQDIVMTNGTIVYIREVTLRDGITMMMKNGDMMDGWYFHSEKRK